MKVLKLGLLAAMVGVIAACPPPEEEPPDVPPAAEHANLDPLADSGVTGELAVTPHENETEIVMSVQGAMPNETHTARLHAGTCEAPGEEITTIGSFNTDDQGRGHVEATVGYAPATVMDGNHIAVVWGPHPTERPDQEEDPDAEQEEEEVEVEEDDEQPIACAVVPQHT